MRVPRIAAALVAGVPLALAGCSGPREVGVGDCLQDLAASQPKIVSCQRPHEGEVVSTVTLAGVTYPGVEAIQQQVRADCQSAFERYVGVPVTESPLDLVPLVPTKLSWEEQSDRTVLCVIRKVDGSLLEEAVSQSGD